MKRADEFKSTQRRFPMALRCACLALFILMSPAGSAQSGVEAEAEVASRQQFSEALNRLGFSCPWSDCRGCAQYRKLCGDMGRNVSALEVQVMAADPGYGVPMQQAGGNTGPGTDPTAKLGAAGDALPSAPEDSQDAEDLNRDLLAAANPGSDADQSLDRTGASGRLESIPVLYPLQLLTLAVLLLLTGWCGLRASD